jgi:ATP-dependent helicase Lhr and Lhr-like helicase
MGERTSTVMRWFAERLGQPTVVQRAAWPRIRSGRHVLIVSPTGTGKTLAAVLVILDDLARQAEGGVLEEGLQALYITPLRALGYDLEKNLQGPLREMYGDASPIRVGLRTGDTPAVERQRQRRSPPHLLVTTPESLLILLSQEPWLRVLRTVRWVVVDEIHALVETKRGAHLSLSLERLEEVAGRPVQRIGLSATVAPAEEVGRFLVGVGRECEVVEGEAGKRIEMEVYSPLRRDPYPQAGFTGERLMEELAALVRRHRTTLVFSNTRSGAESAAHALKQALPEWAEQIECHHASLDRDVRWEVEDRLKRGELRAVVCSSTLELGIDIGSIDLVVMLSTPKGVTRALQRTGRAGHSLDRVSRGLLMATNLGDLVEACATARLARRRHLEEVRAPGAPLDVLAQHLVSWGCTRRWTRQEAHDLARRAHGYRDLSREDLDDVLDYLAGGGKSLRQQYAEVFGKIVLDDEGFETPAGRVRRDFLQNAGTIPDEGLVLVRHRNRVLGTVEERFARGLGVGDVFLLGGRAVRLRRTGMMEVWVDWADTAVPTVPRWNANKMPLSTRVAEEIASFREELRERLESGGDREGWEAWLGERLECCPHNAAIILEVYRRQHAESEIPTSAALLVEMYESKGSDMERAVEAGVDRGKVRRRSGGGQGRMRREDGRRVAGAARHYFFHALAGRAVNDVLARVVAVRMGRRWGGNALATPDDYGFVLTVDPQREVEESDLVSLLSPERMAEDLREGLGRSELVEYHFRVAAQTGLMVYRNYFGNRKPVRKLQWSAEVIFNVLRQHEPGHVLLREAERDAERTFLDLEGARTWAERAVARPLRMRRVERVTPLAFGMYASRMREALMVEDPRETLERLYHLWWQEGG